MPKIAIFSVLLLACAVGGLAKATELDSALLDEAEAALSKRKVAEPENTASDSRTAYTAVNIQKLIDDALSAMAQTSQIYQTVLYRISMQIIMTRCDIHNARTSGKGSGGRLLTECKKYRQVYKEYEALDSDGKQRANEQLAKHSWMMDDMMCILLGITEEAMVNANLTPAISDAAKHMPNYLGICKTMAVNTEVSNEEMIESLKKYNAAGKGI